MGQLPQARNHARSCHVCPRLSPWSVLCIFMLVFMLVCIFKYPFLYACIDMKSPDVVYLSSDDETIFEPNQTLIVEHRVCEDQRATRDHFSRVLEEVKEGNRKFLRIAALPEPSNIPRAVPLDKSLSITVAFKPSNLKFNIMSQESKIGSMSPVPVVKSKVFPFESLQYYSTITKIDHIQPSSTNMV